jgi:hypothetical protein
MDSKITAVKTDIISDVKTEMSVIQDGIKNDVSALKKDFEDKVHKSKSAASVGQEVL